MTEVSRRATGPRCHRWHSFCYFSSKPACTLYKVYLACTSLKATTCEYRFVLTFIRFFAALCAAFAGTFVPLHALLLIPKLYNENPIMLIRSS